MYIMKIKERAEKKKKKIFFKRKRKKIDRLNHEIFKIL